VKTQAGPSRRVDLPSRWFGPRECAVVESTGTRCQTHETSCGSRLGNKREGDNRATLLQSYRGYLLGPYDIYASYPNINFRVLAASDNTYLKSLRCPKFSRIPITCWTSNPFGRGRYLWYGRCLRSSFDRRISLVGPIFRCLTCLIRGSSGSVRRSARCTINFADFPVFFISWNETVR
jgi:hypothetical protein